jgi:hypothetical protein
MKVKVKGKKSKVAYNRKIYIAFLIDSSSHNLVSLIEKTAMPKRTIETSMKGLPDLGIDYEFVQLEGARNRKGYYRILSWGYHDKKMIRKDLSNVIDVLRKDGIEDIQNNVV